jgi:hypothetical protein
VAWLRNGSVISGATQATYTLTANDLGRTGLLPLHGDQLGQPRQPADRC